MKSACEGIGLVDEVDGQELTAPHKFVSHNHPWKPHLVNRSLDQTIVRVLDYPALLRRCVAHGLQMNMWFAA
jgi:hypothetical protein